MANYHSIRSIAVAAASPTSAATTTAPTSVQIPPGFGAAGSANGPTAATAAAAAAAAAATGSTLGALMSQHRLLEFSRFGGLRGYDIAQHMLTQQGAVSKLLGKYANNAHPFAISSHSK